MKYALALAGGGTKGSYQIGVWKALRELGFEFSAVAGTSIGALNGAAIALDEYEKTKKLWMHLDLSYMVEFKHIEKEWSFHKKYESVVDQLKDITKKRGLDISPLRDMLETMVDVKKLKESDIELIVSTISLSKLKPVYMSVRDMPDDEVINYILASAALPIFERIEVDGKPHTSNQATIWRWRRHYQHDFAARMDWCVARDYKRANHNPIAVLNGDRSKRIVELAARPGETVALSASGSSDPDGNAIRSHWMIYREAGSFNGDAELSRAVGNETVLSIPSARNRSSGTSTIHVILTVEDNGSPSLVAYRRAIITVQ